MIRTSKENILLITKDTYSVYRQYAVYCCFSKRHVFASFAFFVFDSFAINGLCHLGNEGMVFWIKCAVRKVSRAKTLITAGL